MLVSFVLICYTLFTAFITGMMFLYILSKLLKINNGFYDFTFSAIAGLCFIAIVISIQHIFYKVGIVSHAIIWVFNGLVWSSNAKIFSVSIFTQWQNLKSKPLKIILIYALFLVGAIVNIMARPATGDAADYHFQAIRWMEEYQVVPGIGNIRRQLGNNSNWFLLNAFFGYSFTGLRSVYVLNASLLLMACFYFSSAFEKILNGNFEKYFIIKSLILFYLMLTVFRKYVGAVTNDFPITVLTLYVFSLLLETNREDVFKRMMIIFFVAVMITFKLSALPMIVFAGLVGMSVFKKLNSRFVIVFSALIVTLFVPWVYTNVMHCGYIVFPISNPDFFAVDWKMRKSVLDWEVMANLAWARVPFADVEITKQYVFAQWFPLWLKSLDGFSIFLMLGSIASMFISAILCSVKKYRNELKKHLTADILYIFVTVVIALYLWFTHGPTPRFVFGYLVFFIGFQMWLFVQVSLTLQKQAKWVGKSIFLLTTAIFFVSCVPFLPKYFTTSSFVNQIVLPKNYTLVNATQVKLEEGFVNVPAKYEQCWDSPIPCTSALDTALTWRGAKMEDGFKIK